MDRIARVEAFPLTIPRDVPYLGALQGAEAPNEMGYYIRRRNRTVYAVNDHSVLVRVTTERGAVGWGECVCVVTPRTVATIIQELVGPLARGRDPHDVVAIYDDLYDAMRVRGFFGGFYHDALAALDIALWDVRGKLLSLPVCKLLGAQRRTAIPCYVSGLPRPTVAERAALAAEWMSKGFDAVKFAAAVSHEGELAEMRAIRQAIGDGPQILVDLHWRYTAPEAIQLISRLEEYDLAVAEAPVDPEDLEGQAQVARAVKTPIATGEELRTSYEYRPRFTNRCLGVAQPEMGRTGITSAWRIAQLAQAFHCRVMPHATIGIGIFQAASLQVAAALSPELAPYHEYQHSIFDQHLRYLRTDMRCAAGHFTLPTGPGIGAEPTDDALRHAG
jgi:galactonate dehydratase